MDLDLSELEYVDDELFLPLADSVALLWADKMIACSSEDERETLYFLMIRLIKIHSVHVPIVAILLFYSLYFHDRTLPNIEEMLTSRNPEYEEEAASNKSIACDLLKRWERGGGKKSIPICWEEVRDTIFDLVYLARIWPDSCDGLLDTMSSCLMFLYQATSPSTVLLVGMEGCKMAILQLFNILLKNKYWARLIPETPSEEIDLLINKFCDWCSLILDETHVEGSMTFMKDSPMLLDYEITYDLATFLKDVSIELRPLDLDLARVEYLVSCLENLTVFSGNSQLQLDRRVEQDRDDRRVPALTVSHDHIPLTHQRSEEDIDLFIKVSLIQDLFPEQGRGFIEACLNEYDQNTELLIMTLLENNLPPHLANLDRSMPSLRAARTASTVANSEHNLDSLTDHMLLSDDGSFVVEEQPTSLLLNRRNIYDGDKFDVFQSGNRLDPALVYQKNQAGLDIDYEEQERLEFLRQQKESIINNSNQAALQDEMDEYDDTYDLQDVQTTGLFQDDEDQGGQIKKVTLNKVEEYLVNMYQSEPTLFHPSYRKSKERAAMRDFLHYSDEQIEGWFIMLNRDVGLFI